MKKLFFLLTVTALVVSALSVAPAHGATPVKTPAPENIWAFFEALPDAGLPEDINTRAKRVDYHKDYEDKLLEIEAAQADATEEGEEYYDDALYLPQIEYSIFWDPTALEPYWISQDYMESEGSLPAITLATFQGSDPDRIFGILRVLEHHYEEASTVKATQYYWYSVSKNTVTPTQLPLDVPYTDEEITDDGLFYYGQNELYWAMRDHHLDWEIDRDCITLTLEGIGSVPVSYNWNGTKFVRDRFYSPMIIHSGGIGNIQIGESTVTYGVHGYDIEWMNVDDEYTRAWRYIKEGEETPRMIVYAYGTGIATTDAIDIFYPGYKLLGSIHAGMPAAEAIEAIKDWYSWEDPDARDPYVSAFDGKAWIFTGRDDPFMLAVDLKYYKNEKLSPNAVIEFIRVAPAVG
jgi:hypothetical protein